MRNPALPLAIAGLVFAGSLTPMLSTAGLGLHHACDPLMYSAVAFGSLFGLGIIIAAGRYLNSRESSTLGLTVTAIGFAGTGACLFAGMATIPQEVLQETLTGRIFMHAGVAPAALETGPIVGVDIAFAVVGSVLAILLITLAAKADGRQHNDVLIPLV